MQNKQQWIIYKTTTDFDDSFYIGVHKTNISIDDGYRGSGYLLKKKISKHGIEHFNREILYTYDNEDEALAKEKEIVNDDLLKDINCLNLTYGGGCGWKLINQKIKNGEMPHPMLNKHHSKASCDKIQEHHYNYSSNNNPMYKSKKYWVTYTDGITNIRIGDGLRAFYIPEQFREGKFIGRKGKRLNVLIVPDIHSKKYILDKFLSIIEQNNKLCFDKVIFLGDYIDGFVETDVDMIYCLESVIKLKQKYMNDVILLLANHEFSYLGNICSGHRYHIENKITKLLIDNKQLFQICYAINNCIFSHAGITKSWLSTFNEGSLGKFTQKPWDNNCEIQRMVACINNSLLDLSIPGFYRSGGNYQGMGSCIWADKRELLMDYLDYCDQVVGHTPVPKVEIYKKSRNKNNNSTLVFTDTFSTYRDGTIYGDMSYVVYHPKSQHKGNQFEIRYLQ